MDSTAAQIQIPPEIRTYLENILQDAQMTTALDNQMREDMVFELYKQLDNYLASVVVDKMPPEFVEEFIKLNEQPTTKQQAEAFIKEKLPNSQQVLAEAFVHFRDMYVHNVSAARENQSQQQEQPQNTN